MCIEYLGGRFDQHFIARTLYARRLKPKLIMTGNNIYQMSIKVGRKFANLIFRDSWMLLMAPLDALKKTFNLKCENKLYFPYLFNKKANKHAVLDHLPPIGDYCPNTMKPEKREKFIEWYNQNKNTPFSLFEKLKE